MNFVAIPPGAGIAAALTLRGADPMLVVANADTFVTSLGDALHSVAGAAGHREMAFANVAGELVGGLFTRDAVLLGMPVHLFVVGPACMRAGWLQLLANGLDDSAAMTCRQFRDARQAVLDSLDLGAIPAGTLQATSSPPPISSRPARRSRSPPFGPMHRGCAPSPSRRSQCLCAVMLGSSA